MVIDTLSSDNVAGAIRPDAVSAVLSLLQRVFGATLAAVGYASAGSELSRDFGNCLAGADLRNGDWGRLCCNCCQGSDGSEEE